MRKVFLAILVSVLLCGTAEAGITSGLVTAWNILPAAINLLNRGLHFVCGTVHEGLHGLADVLHIDVTPSEPKPTVPQ